MRGEKAAKDLSPGDMFVINARYWIYSDIWITQSFSGFRQEIAKNIIVTVLSKDFQDHDRVFVKTIENKEVLLLQDQIVVVL